MDAAIGWRGFISSPCTRWCPRAGFSVVMRITGLRIAAVAAKRPTSLRDAIEHLAEEAQRLRRLATVSDVA